MSTSTVEKGADLTEEQAIELAGEIEWTEAAVKEMKNQLKDYVKQYGELETSEKIWEMSSSISWKIDAGTLREMSQDIVLEGFNPWELLSLPKSSLDKLNWDEDVLAQYGTKKETQRFTSRKK